MEKIITALEIGLQSTTDLMSEAPRRAQVELNARATVIKAAIASAAAPQVVADGRELPPLPKRVDYREGKTPEYTADQMQAYARAALASAPVQAQEPEEFDWCAFENAIRNLDYIHRGIYPARDYDLDGSFVTANIGHAKKLAGAVLPRLNAAYAVLTRKVFRPIAPVQPVAVPDPLYQAMHDFRDDVLSGIDGLDNDQINAVLGTFDNYMLDEPAAPAAQGNAWSDKCEALIDIWDDGNKPEGERAYASGAFPEMLEEIRAAIAAKAAS